MTLERGFFVQVAGEWYPVDGLCLTHYPGGAVDGSVFTLKPNGRPAWQEYFDLIIVDAKKPGFFLNRGRPAPPRRWPAACRRCAMASRRASRAWS